MATCSRAWKKCESWWAKLHGEERSGPTGRDLPDVTNNRCPIGIEVKLQNRRTLRSEDIEQADTNARKLGLPWMLVLHEKNHNHADDLVVMPVSTYLGIITGLLEFDLPEESTVLARKLLKERSP